MANYGMAFDYQLCINCRASEVACKEENGIELGASAHRLWIQENNTPKKNAKITPTDWPLLYSSSLNFQPLKSRYVLSSSETGPKKFNLILILHKFLNQFSIIIY